MEPFADQVIQRQRSGTTGDQEDQCGRPGEVIRPASGVNKDLDYHRHGEERGGAEPGR